MKKNIAYIILVLFIFSCSDNDDSSSKFYNETLPVESVNLPEEFRLGETYNITITYIRPTTCYGFNSLYFEKNGYQNTIAVVANVALDNDSCKTLDEEMETSFVFSAGEKGPYIFKFWKGKRDYLIIEVPVII